MNLKKQIIKFLAAWILLVVLAVGVVACDNAQHDEDKQTEPEVTTTEPTETTTLVETTTPTKETTTEPAESLSQEELIEKYPPISDEEYEDFISFLSSKDSNFNDGVSLCLFTTRTDGLLQIDFVGTNYRAYYNIMVDELYFDQISGVVGSYLKESNDIYLEVEKQLFSLNLTDISLTDQLKPLYKILYDATMSYATSYN